MRCFPTSLFQVLAVLSLSGQALAQATTPVLDVSPTSLSFSADASQNWLSLRISNVGTDTLNWSVVSSEPWLSVNPPGGSGDRSVGIHVDRTGLSDGNYAASIQITSNGGSAIVPVALAVSTVPILAVYPTLLDLNPLNNSAGIAITNESGGTLAWSAAADQPWIQLAPPTSGSGEAWVPVAVDLQLLPLGPGQQIGHIDVVSNGGTDQVTVRYNRVDPRFPGMLRVTADETGEQCHIYEPPAGLLEIAVVHWNATDVTGCRFAAPMPSCMAGKIYLGDSSPFTGLSGNSQTGMTVHYDDCLSGTFLVVSMLFYSTGQSVECCQYDVVGDPSASSGVIVAFDCASEAISVQGQPGFLNADAALCPCASVVGTKQTTWGRVKSLYAPEHR